QAVVPTTWNAAPRNEDDAIGPYEAAGLTMVPSLTGAPAVILIDDKYQSGVTLQYVASRLYQAGARRVYGLCAVKTMRDTDNV
ncbi:MAG: nickel-dependent hydrogenase large subunit, partial [Alphaproteobacteria bacterium]|nr:nickel-dependent hydrogenase large subunit [Alphaproteobacteria bacterium]